MSRRDVIKEEFLLSCHYLLILFLVFSKPDVSTAINHRQCQF